MVASMAHQVRTPLSAALLYASQLGMARLDERQRQRFAGRIMERLRHLERQVNDMLVFAREGRFVMDQVDANEFLQRLREAAEPHIDCSNIDLRFRGQCGNARFQGNLEALLGACLNLMSNAMEAMHGSGSLTVEVNRKDNWLCFSVIDDGPGIDPRLQKRIFEPFYTTRPNGTGLGLAVVDSIAKAHGGYVRCTSRPGHGSRFDLCLPLAVQDLPLPGGMAECSLLGNQVHLQGVME